LFAYGIFKVIYAPHKAFKEIVQSPKYLGPILIMILYVVANMGFVYTVMSKTYVEQTLPAGSELDEWTENLTGWTSSANIAESNDSLTGIYYGNKSIEFSAINASRIWAQLDNIGSIDCSDLTGYRNVSFRTKLIYPNTTQVPNVSFSLFSGPTDYFYRNLTQRFISANSTLWYNLTVPTGSASAWENPTARADWKNITSLRFEFAWSENASLVVRVDGLFFRGIFKPFMEDGIQYVLSYSLSAFMQFFIQWFFLGGLLYVIARPLGAKVAWKPVLIVAGFALVTLLIQTIISTCAYATMPILRYPLEIVGGTKDEFATAYSKILDETWLVSQVTGFVRIAMYFWTIILAGIATRLLTEFSWTKSLLVAAVAYIISIIAQAFIFGI
jgi:hypothetical protein